jgi:large subunit ribosomal protein L25
MERVELDVKVRDGLGKGASRRTRAAGRVPAVLYGSGTAPVALQIEARALDRVLQRGTNTLIDLKGPKEVAEKLVLVKEVQRDPLSRKFVHCDLFAVDTAKKITVSVPIHIEGKAAGVEMGGVLEPVMRELEVSCLPLSIPEAFSLDVSPLGIGESLHVSDIALPEDVETAVDLSFTVIHVIAPRVEEAVEEEAAEVEEVAPAAGEPAAEGTTPETPAKEGGES